MDLFGPKPKIKKMLATEKLERPIYPLQLTKIKDDRTEVILKNTISADVNYDNYENVYYAEFNDLNIMVWGNNREEIDTAFQFAFISLVQNIYNESDENLTLKAKVIKQKLSELIDQIK